VTLVITGAVVVAIVALVWPGSRLPSYVDDITVVNPHPWDVGVDVTGAERDGWLGMGTVDRTASHAFGQVIDQGEQWVFRFTYSGVDGGELVVTRNELEASDWKVTVPELFAERMRASGLGPSE
jgi:hypothetical protein